ncbi:MAG: phage head-tail connector protein [Methylocystis sp.]
MALGIGPRARLTVVSTITMAATSRLLASLSDVKDELNIDQGDASKDALLNRYIGECSAAIENFCNRVFSIETIKDRIFPSRDVPLNTIVDGIDPVQLSRWPVTELVALTEDGAALVEDVDFILDMATGQITRLDANLYPARWGAWPIVVDYKAGYATIPSDVSDAAIRAVAQRYLSRGRDRMLRGETVDGIGASQYWVSTDASSGAAEGNLSPDVVSLLDNYRVPQVF